MESRPDLSRRSIERLTTTLMIYCNLSSDATFVSQITGLDLAHSGASAQTRVRSLQVELVNKLPRYFYAAGC